MRTRGVTRRTVLAGAAAGLGGAIFPGAAGAALRHAVPRYPADAPVIGAMGRYVCSAEDTLLGVARRFGLGFTEMVAANQGIDPWLPGAGTEVVLPTAHLLPETPAEGLVLNLADQRLYLLRGGVARATYPIGIGRQGWATPTGRTAVVRKTENPVWRPPESIREKNSNLPKKVPPGPRNPLGQYAIYLGWPTYLLHGTNMPWGIGRRISHGCVRLYPEDIPRLYERVSVGTPVRVVDQPAKLGWVSGSLVLEVHPNQQQGGDLARTGSFEPAVIGDLPARIVEDVGDRDVRVDWPTVDRLVRERRGVPERITRPERAS